MPTTLEALTWDDLRDRDPLKAQYLRVQFPAETEALDKAADAWRYGIHTRDVEDDAWDRDFPDDEYTGPPYTNDIPAAYRGVANKED